MAMPKFSAVEPPTKPQEAILAPTPAPTLKVGLEAPVSLSKAGLGATGEPVGDND